MVPVLGTIKAGWDGSILAEHIGFEPAYGLVSPENHTWLVISGDSMSPTSTTAIIVLIKNSNVLKTAIIVAAILGGENATIKIYKKRRRHSAFAQKPLPPLVFRSKTERERALYLRYPVELKRKF